MLNRTYEICIAHTWDSKNRISVAVLWVSVEALTFCSFQQNKIVSPAIEIGLTSVMCTNTFSVQFNHAKIKGHEKSNDDRSYANWTGILRKQTDRRK